MATKRYHGALEEVRAKPKPESNPVFRGHIRGFSRAQQPVTELPPDIWSSPQTDEEFVPSVFGEWAQPAKQTWVKEPSLGGPDKIEKWCLDRRAFDEWKLAEANDEEEPEADFCFVCMGELNFVVTASGTLRTECTMCGEEWGGETYQLTFVSRKPPEAPYQMRRFFGTAESQAQHYIQKYSPAPGKPGVQTEYVPRSLTSAPDSFVKRLFLHVIDSPLDTGDAFRVMTAARWPDGTACPYCGVKEPFLISTRNQFRCRASECARQFSVTTDTSLHRCRIPPADWLRGLRLLAKERNHISYNRLAAEIGVTGKTAFRMLALVRRELSPIANNG